MIELEGKINKSIPYVKDHMTKTHLQFLYKEIEDVTGEEQFSQKIYRPLDNEMSIQGDKNRRMLFSGS